MKRKLTELGRDFGQFGQAWGRMLFRVFYQLFSQLELVKRGVAHGLYRQRGRFARPFMHTAMGGVVALGVTLAPVLASTFPGIDADAEVDVRPEVSVMEANIDQSMTTIVPADRVRDRVIEYLVQPGDTVSAVAEKFGISTDTVRWENGLASINAIKPGQKLRILPVTGVKHSVGRGETVYSIAKKYGTDAQAIADFPFNTFSDNESFSLAVG